jgi:hypothetical protein
VSSLDPILWAFKVAPVRDGIEKLVLQTLCDHADEDGCNAYPAQLTIAERAMSDARTVRKRLAELERRGLIRRGDQGAVNHLPPDRRPVVWEVMIPYTAFGDGIDTVNRWRATKGRPPITPKNRPPLPDAPSPAPRVDKGVKRTPPRVDSESGRTSSPPGTTVPPESESGRGRTSSPERADLKSYNLPLDLPLETVPSPDGSLRSPSAHDDPDTATEPDGDPVTAQTILGGFIDYLRGNDYGELAGRVKGQLAREIKALLEDGFHSDRIKLALVEWYARSLHPSNLASVAQHVGHNRPAPPRRRPSDDIDWDAAMTRAQAKDAANREAG